MWFATIGAALGFAFGLGGCFYLAWKMARQELREAEETASEIIETTNEKMEDLFSEAKARIEEYTESLQDETADEFENLSIKIEKQTETLAEKQARLDQNLSGQQELSKKKMQILRSHEERIGELHREYEQLRQDRKNLEQQWVEKLLSSGGFAKSEILGLLKERIERDAKDRIKKWAQELDQDTQQNLERDARRVLNLALSRFARPYCPERGIGNINFPNSDVFKRTVGVDREHIKSLEKVVGVDITLNEEYLYASVLGFDPVRRELGRASLEKLMHEKDLNEKRIGEIVLKTKRDLFRKIRQNGNEIAKELGLRGLHQEIRNMMGALRYRYSFAQNQYFHCGEVGWLCGLLSSELGLDLMDGRRAGMLHDIGKAMDHSKEGGHAVIGADFIKNHDEKDHIVHAVRAHHYDETPTTELCYLVIAADALSGARPGARRSTMDSYHQKMQDLEKIGNSFEGVLDTYILSAGREMRLSVDSRLVDDHKALEISKNVAQKIEEEMSYPGLIKVIVVRETSAIEIAK